MKELGEDITNVLSSGSNFITDNLMFFQEWGIIEWSFALIIVVLLIMMLHELKKEYNRNYKRKRKYRGDLY